MTWAIDLVTGVNAIYDVGGVAATYTDRDSVVSEVVALVDYNLAQYGVDSVEVSKATAAISVRVSQMEFRPRQGDTFVIGSDTFVVSNPLESDELEHTVLVS